jgi:hypothetical protein
MKKSALYCAVMIIVVFSCVSVVSAQDSFTPIRFDFEGPDVPAEWAPRVFSGGTREIIDESLVITAPTGFGGASSDFGFVHANLIVETQVRFLDGGSREDYASILIRSTVGEADGYYGSVSSEGNLLMSRVTPSGNVDPVVQATATGFDAINQDLKLRLVADGSFIGLFAWSAGAEMPQSPSLWLSDDTYSDGNEISLFNTSFESGSPSWPIAFRYVEISPVVPLPRCDFNADGICGGSDIDLMYGLGDLITGVTPPPGDTRFDLNLDGIVDVQDLDQWMADAATMNGFSAPYLKGDADLNGVVDADDLNRLALNWRQDGAAWSGGDFTADGVVGAGDLNALALNWQQSIPMASSANATVPEPSGWPLTIVGLALIWQRRRRGCVRDRVREGVRCERVPVID